MIFDTEAMRQWEHLPLPDDERERTALWNELRRNIVVAAQVIDEQALRITNLERWLKASTPVAGSDPRSAMHDPNHPFHTGVIL